MNDNQTTAARSLASPPRTSFGKETRTTLMLALPIMGGHVLQNAMNVIDTIMVGKVNVDSVAAASLAGALFVVPLVFGFGALGPFSVFVAGSIAREKPGEAANYLRTGLILGGSLGAIVAVSIAAVSGFLRVLHQPVGVVTLAEPFLLLLTASVIPIFLFQILKQYCEAHHNAWPPMLILTGGVLVNVGLNWVFIFGHLGFPAMGLIGAGWATLIARLLVMAVMAVVVWRIHFHSRLMRDELFRVSLGWKTYRDLFGLGLPGGLQVILEVGAFTFAAIMMGWISATALAAHQVSISVASTTFMLPMGLATAVAIRVSHAVESNDPQRARWCVGGSLLLALGFMSITAVIICTFAREIAGCFVRDAGVISLAARLLLVAGFFQIFDGTQVICGGALRGLRDVRIPSLLNFGGYWLAALPVSYHLAFRFHWGALGIWWGLLTGLAFVSGLLLIRLKFKLPRGPKFDDHGRDFKSGEIA